MNKSRHTRQSPDACSTDLPTYDDTVLIGMVDGDADLAAEVIDQYTSALQCGINDIAASHLGGNIHDLIIAAHKLKSSSRTVGAMRLGELCERLENGAKDGTVDGIRRLIEAVSAESVVLAGQLVRDAQANAK